MQSKTNVPRLFPVIKLWGSMLLFRDDVDDMKFLFDHVEVGFMVLLWCVFRHANQIIFIDISLNNNDS